MEEILSRIVKNAGLHTKWLNTLSFMENAGARKISACEDPLTTDIIQLKHAMEEHRHAYYLKKQIARLEPGACPHYHNHELLAPLHTRQYLHRLDISCCRYLVQQFGLSGKALKYAAYLLVTYAIEVRADRLYPAYQEVLTRQQSKVMVKSIIAEEEGHLEEMTAMLEDFDPHWQLHADAATTAEEHLFDAWFRAVTNEVLEHACV